MKKNAWIMTICLLSALLILFSACRTDSFKPDQANSPLLKEDVINIALAAIPENHGSKGIEKVELYQDESEQNEITQEDHGWALILRVLLTIDGKLYVNTVAMFVGNDGSVKDFKTASDLTELSIYRGEGGK